MAIKQISIGDAQFEFDASIVNDNGFLITLTEYKVGDQKDVAETYVDINLANQIINLLEEAIKFSESLPSISYKNEEGD